MLGRPDPQLWGDGARRPDSPCLPVPCRISHAPFPRYGQTLLDAEKGRGPAPGSRLGRWPSARLANAKVGPHQSELGG